MQYISGLFFRIDWLDVSHSLALNSAQAAQSIRNTQQVLAHEFKGERYDVGDKFGYMMTNIEYGLEHKDL